MTVEEYKKLWKEAIHLCEIEPNREEAIAFVYRFYDKYPYATFSNRDLLLTFVGLVVYETRFNLRFGSTTPASKCYRELLRRIDDEGFDKEFIYDVGDWSAEYSNNSYVPMDNYNGFGPRRFFEFRSECETRTLNEKTAKEERIAKLREEGRKKVEAAKQKHQERMSCLQMLREKTIEEQVAIILRGENLVYYYIEIVEELFKSKLLSDNQKDNILSIFPDKSTRHNNRIRKRIESLY